MNMKRARFWRNLLLFSALSGAASLHPAHAQEGVSRVGDGSAGPGAAGVPTPEGVGPLSPSPYMPLDPGYNFPRPTPPALPPASDTLANSRRSAFGPRYDIGQFLGDRLGVADNDTNFNFLLPFLMGSENNVLFIDGRGVVTQLGKGAASAGIGYRSYDPYLNRINGLSGWVDYDQGHHRTYQQAGVSFESLGTWMDVRVNGYIPFGQESYLYGSSITGNPFFGGSSLLVNQRQLTESAYKGLDAEIGGPLPLLGRYGVSGYVGGYWLDANTDRTAAGPRVRVEANVTDGMRVSVTASDDPVFGTNAWVNLNLTLPDGRPRRWFRPIPVEDRMLRTVERSYRVQTHSKAENVATSVLSNGQPVRVIFVDPDRVANGNGTLESPYNKLQGFANTAANTLIVIDGSTTSQPVIGTVTLFDDQKLVSTALLAAGAVTLNTNLGVITLPRPAGFGDATLASPILQSPSGGTLVTLNGDRIEVTGMTFDGTTSSVAIPNSTAIAGSNLNGFNIHHNVFHDYTDGVVLNNALGVGLLQANAMTGTPGVSVDGFRLTNSGVGRLDLFANVYAGPGTGVARTANTISGNDNAGMNITARNRAVINAHIVGNTISDNGQGVILEAAASDSLVRASIVGNTIDGNRGEDRNLNGILDPGEDVNGDSVLNPGNGVLLMANASTLNLATVGEDVNLNGKLDATEDTNGNGILDGGYVLAGNTITRNTGDGVAVQSINNSLVNMIAVRNNFGDPLDHSTGNLGRGLSIAASSGTVRARIGFVTNEDINFNGVKDTGEDTNGNGQFDVANPLDANNFVANRAGGMFVDLSGTAVGNIVALNNTITGVGTGSLTFQIVGANNGSLTGAPFSIVNSSPLGNDVTGVVWNLAPAGVEFNTTGANSTSFGAQNNTDVSTGLTSVNGTTSSFSVIDQATSLNLQFASFLSVNGVLDTGEDTNSNGQLDPGEDLPLHFDFNVGTSGPGGVPAVLSGNNFIGSQITATFSSGQVLSGTMQAIAGSATASQFVASATGSSSGSGPGVEMRVSQTAALTNPIFVGNTIQGSGGAGFTATATDDGQINGLLLRNNTIQNNGSAANNGGISLNTVAATTAQINGSILSNTVSGNFGPGVSVTANSGTINVTQIDSNTMGGNTNGVALSTLNNGTISTRVTNNTMSNSLGDGFIATANTGVINLNQFSDNTLNNAGGNGIVLTALNAGTINIPNSEDINGNATLDPGEDVNSNGLLDLGMRNNSLNNPVGNGLFVSGNNGTFNLGTISGLSIDRSTSGTGGIVFDVTDSTTTGSFVGNTLTAAVGNANRGAGFNLTATNGTFDVTIGGPNASDSNLIQNNRGAGISILAQNTAVGTFDINNNVITGTVDDANATTPFSGQGIYVGTATAGTLTPATAVFNNASIVNNTIGNAASAALGNTGGGLFVELGDQTSLNGLTIDGNIIAHNGPAALPVALPSAANVVNGVTFLRTGDATIDNVSLTDNQITNNVNDGVYLHALGGSTDVLNFVIQGNTISNNGVNGINLRAESDSQLQVAITDNSIASNGFNGIVLTTFTNSPLNEHAAVTGTWSKNTIQNNAARGVEVSGLPGFGAAQPLVIGLNGTDPVDGLSLGNTISGNGMGGIEINAASNRGLLGGLGNLEINNNLITGNGASPTALGVTDVNGTGGIDINMTNGFAAPASPTAGTVEFRARLTNNFIQSNTGDGFQLGTLQAAQPTTLAPITSTVSMLGNTIDSNTGRGINVLNQTYANTNLQIGNGTLLGSNSIINNGLEGVYIVNTASATQSQNGNALLANGALLTVAPFNTGNLLLDVRNNDISYNNNGGTFAAGGFVLRAGSSNVGAVTARFSGNALSGNLGDDVWLETFTSTVTPAAPPTPIANLGLVFQGDTGNSLNPNQSNASYTIGAVVFPASNMRIETGFNSNGFTNGGPGGSGAFAIPASWTVVPAGTFSAPINSFVFP